MRKKLLALLLAACMATSSFVGIGSTDMSVVHAAEETTKKWNEWVDTLKDTAVMSVQLKDTDQYFDGTKVIDVSKEYAEKIKSVDTGSIILRFKADSLDSAQVLLGVRNTAGSLPSNIATKDANSSTMMLKNAEKFRFVYSYDGAESNGVYSFTDGNWHTVVLSGSSTGKNIRLTIDGSEAWSVSNRPDLAGMFNKMTAIDQVTIGGHKTGDSVVAGFNGMISDVIVTKETISDKDAIAISAAGCSYVKVSLSDKKITDFDRGALVGTLFVEKTMPGDTPTYTLCEGEGSRDNALFTIIGDKLKVKGEIVKGRTYQIRVKAQNEDFIKEAVFELTAVGENLIFEKENLTIAQGNSVDLTNEEYATELFTMEEGTVVVTYTFTGDSSVQTLFSIGNGTEANGHFHVYVTPNGRLGCEIRNESGLNYHIYTDNAVVKNKETTIAFKADKENGEYKLFVNGELVNTKKASALGANGYKFVPDINGAESSHIGITERSNSANYTFSGTVKNIQVYGTALPDERITNPHPTEELIQATYLTAPNGWTKNATSMDAKLTLGNSPLVKTSGALAFELLGASAFELLATCGNNTGMVMAVVKDANGKTLRSYLVDTYYNEANAEVNVPIVRDMKLIGDETVDVYACLVKNVVDNRVKTMSAMGRAVEVTTDDIVMALLEELGLDNELDVADVNVSYMSEDSVLKGGASSSINTYATAPMTTEMTGNDTEYTVSVQGCRIYKTVNGVEHKALSDLVADGKTAFISKNATEFILSDYQKTGPQNEIYLDSGESIVLGLANVVSGEVAIRVRTVNSATDDGAYRTLTFEPVEGHGYQATITNAGTERIALGMIKMSGVASASFIMTDDIAKAVVAAMNAEPTEEPTVEPTETPKEVINPFADVKEGDYFYDAVLWAVEEKVTTGVSETSFAPWEECTRGQVVTFLWRAAGSPKIKDTEITFKDVVAGEYYEDAVRWAVKEGITTGYSEEVFAPYDKCTRAQVVTFLWRAAGKPSPEDVKNPFADVVAGEYYEEAVQWAVQNGITTGVDPEHFAPNDTCLRGQTVTFLYRVSK